MLVVFTLLYRFSPNLRLNSREVLPGSILASGGWIISSSVFAWYVEHFADYTIIYGSLGGIVVLLTWLYLSSIVILVGGELNAVLRAV
jgi:membrane protein